MGKILHPVVSEHHQIIECRSQKAMPKLLRKLHMIMNRMNGRFRLGRRQYPILMLQCRDKRIFSTGCAGKLTSQGCSGLLMYGESSSSSAENTKMNDCFFEKKDWRQCRTEVRRSKSSSLALCASVYFMCNQWEHTDKGTIARKLQAMLEEA